LTTFITVSSHRDQELVTRTRIHLRGPITRRQTTCTSTEVNRQSPSERSRAFEKPPVVKIEGDARRTVFLGQPLTLTALATDDGIPRPRPTPLQLPARYTAIGLRVAW